MVLQGEVELSFAKYSLQHYSIRISQLKIENETKMDLNKLQKLIEHYYDHISEAGVHIRIVRRLRLLTILICA